MFVRQAWSAGFFAMHRPSVKGLRHISSLDPALCQTRVEEIFYNSKKLHIFLLNPNGFTLEYERNKKNKCIKRLIWIVYGGAEELLYLRNYTLSH